MHTLDIAPLRSESPPQKRSGMTRVLKGSHSFTCTFIRNRNEPYRLAVFAFPAMAGTHLPTPKGWKAEWTLVRSSPTSQLQIRHSTTQPLAHLLLLFSVSLNLFIFMRSLRVRPGPDRFPKKKVVRDILEAGCPSCHPTN